MMKRNIVTLVALLALAAPPAGAEDAAKRQLGAHVHGQGQLDIAIEDGRIAMELEAPGADIAGFEHAASTDADKAARDKALTVLRDGIALFKFPREADCKLSKAEANLEAPDDHGGDAHKNADGAKAEHSAFHAEYIFTCAVPAKLDAIATAYFTTFPKAQSLTVNIVAPKGQSQMQLTREKPTVALTGLI